MADPVWQDTVTPLNAANMNKLQTRDEKGAPSGYAPLGADSKVPAANLPPAAAPPDLTPYQAKAEKGQPSGYVGLDAGSNVSVAGYIASRVSLSIAQAGDTVNRYLVDNTGKILWGPGNAAADTFLSRGQAGALTTPGSITAQSGFISGSHIWIDQSQNGYVINFGPAADAQLWRPASGALKTNANFYAQGIFRASQGQTNQIELSDKLYFGIAADTNLYRLNTSALRTNAQVWVDQAVYLNMALSADKQVFVGQLGGSPGAAGLTLGGDVKLYRGAANQLKTDGQFYANGAGASPILLNTDGGIYFGPSDTVIYRSAAATIQIINNLSMNGTMTAGIVTAAGPLWINDNSADLWKGLLFGTAQDAKLYRYSANTLATPGNLRIDGAAANGGSSSGLLITFGIYGARWVDVGPPDSGGSGYRAVVVAN